MVVFIFLNHAIVSLQKLCKGIAMKKIIDKTMDVLVSNDPTIELQRRKYEYGLNVFFSSLFNMLGILLIFAVTGHLEEVLILIAFFATLRTFVGGYHAKSRINCFVFFLSLAVGMLWLNTSISFGDYRNELFFGLVQCILFIAVFAPMDTSSKPLKKVEKQSYRKKSLIIVISQSVLIFGLYMLSFESAALIGILGIYAAVFTMVIRLLQQVLKGELTYEFKVY